MQAADFWHANDPAHTLGRTSKRRILVQRKMRPGGVIVADVGRHSATQMRLVEHDQMVEALPSDGSDQSLDIRVLPWTARCSRPISNAH